MFEPEFAAPEEDEMWQFIDGTVKFILNGSTLPNCAGPMLHVASHPTEALHHGH
jgi:hypothetical protein